MLTHFTRAGRHVLAQSLHTRVAGLFPDPPLPPFTVDFCSYQASISVEKASARLSLLPPWLVAPTGFSLAMAGTAVTVPLAGEGLAGSSGGTDSLLVEDLWLAEPDLGESESAEPWGGQSLSDFRLLALVLRNLVEYL